jgi:hypothetical protein
MTVNELFLKGGEGDDSTSFSFCGKESIPFRINHGEFRTNTKYVFLLPK